MDSTAFVVLAAGAGRRFGGGKLDANLRGRPLGRWATNAVESTGSNNRYIVVGDSPPSFTSDLQGWTIIRNPDANRGIGTSINMAAETLSHFDRIVISLADMPFVIPSHLMLLAQAKGAMFTRHVDGRPGVPAVFLKAHFLQLSKLPDDVGAASLARQLSAKIAPSASPAMLIDIDTKDDLEAAMTEH